MTREMPNRLGTAEHQTRQKQSQRDLMISKEATMMYSMYIHIYIIVQHISRCSMKHIDEYLYTSHIIQIHMSEKKSIWMHLYICVISPSMCVHCIYIYIYIYTLSMYLDASRYPVYKHANLCCLCVACIQTSPFVVNKTHTTSRDSRVHHGSIPQLQPEMPKHR